MTAVGTGVTGLASPPQSHCDSPPWGRACLQNTDHIQLPREPAPNEQELIPHLNPTAEH